MPKIESALKKLNITLAGFLTDPSLFVKFLKDQVDHQQAKTTRVTIRVFLFLQ